jgi:hypothetical protein
MRAIPAGALLFTLLSATCSGHAAATPPASDPPPLPANWAYDSYQIYSQALLVVMHPTEKDPLTAFGNPGSSMPRPGPFRVQAATITAVPPGQDCEWSKSEREREEEPTRPDDPHPNANHKQDFKEILENFDAHCHDVWSLSSIDFGAWDPKRPTVTFQLTSSEAANEIASRPEWCSDEAPLIGEWVFEFSAVYFNNSQTVAIVYVKAVNGIRCQRKEWLAFEMQDGRWKRFHWNIAPWLS